MRNAMSLMLLHAILIGLGVSQRLDVDLVGLVDLALSSVSDEDGLASPLDDDILALGDGVEVDLDLGHGQDIGGRGHVLQELCSRGLTRVSKPLAAQNGLAVEPQLHRLGTGGSNGTHGTDHEVGDEVVRADRVLGHVAAPVGDLGGLAVALEGAAVVAITERAGGRKGADGAEGSGLGGLSREGAMRWSKAP
ncbi:hypothetical protein PG997_008340 [Apiospora hydei]|uniref:Secreted protein n=1 Tax=Apiospora hydei TaxID=1337664 RepID=A0ABR1WAK8_9PEZI